MNRMLTIAALALAFGALAGCTTTKSGLAYVAEDGTVKYYQTRARTVPVSLCSLCGPVASEDSR